MFKTTHVGSLPRPAEMITRQLRKEEITTVELGRYVAELLERQLSLGLSYVNNGELPRIDYINSTVQRITGFNSTCTAPLPRDLEELPDYARRFSGRNGLITLNPKAPVELPACSDELVYVGQESLQEEIGMMVDGFHVLCNNTGSNDCELFFTAPSPGTVALFLENHYYPDYESYLGKLGEILRYEYELIINAGLILQIDCPDLAMGRHTRYKDLDENTFLGLIEQNISVLNEALASIDPMRCRAHICWGNYPGTHHCDLELRTIVNHINRLKPAYISLESCNHRHAHEWEVFRDQPLADDKILMPGVIDTTSNTVEHPELVASRLLSFANLLGADRVVGSTDCGFASTASAAGVSGEVAWLKLQSLVQGAKIADKIIAP